MYDFKGKVALVTGARNKLGMGRAIAVRMAQEGADVVIVDRFLPPEGLNEEDVIEGWQGILSVAEEIKALGRRALPIKADISDSQQVERMVAQAIESFGHIDILVNNAAIREATVNAVDMEDGVWEEVLSINLSGTFRVSRAVARGMIARGRGGKIVNIASTAGKTAIARGIPAAYVASKFGVVGLTQTLALELAEHKINVNAICPGTTATEISWGASIRKDMRQLGLTMEEAINKGFQRWLPHIPLGRVGRPEEIANLAAFLASDQADYITGVAILHDGGMCIGA